MILATADYETYSEAGYIRDPASGLFIPLQKGKPGLKCVNAPVYAEHPSARIISLAYDLRDGVGVRLWTPDSPPPVAWFNYIWSGGIIEAHNSGFEYYISFYIAHLRMGWPLIPLNQFMCSMAKAKAHSLPGKLSKLAEVLGADEQKDKRGTQLIQLLTKPNKPTKANPEHWKTFAQNPELYYEMYSYNDQDVKSEMSTSELLPDLSPTELAVWRLDQEINVRGVQVDTESLGACIQLFYEIEKKYTAELVHITGGAVKTVGEMTKGSAGDLWLQSMGVNLPSLDKKTVEEAVKRTDLHPAALRALQIRQEIGGAAVKKIFAMQRTLNSDNRIRDMYNYCGAGRTARWSGNGAQGQNLRNGGPDAIVCGTCGGISAVQKFPSCRRCGSLINLKTIEWGNTAAKAALADVRMYPLEIIELLWGSATDLIGSCIRSLFIARDGMDFICSDYSAIEAVVLAALAGEQWRLDVFNTHGKIYEASASQASGIPLQEILDHKTKTGKHHPLRKKGKVRELAGGYQGWINAWKNFGADKYMSDDEIKADVISWRKESPMIEEMWGGQWRKTPGRWHFTPELYGVEGAFISACLNPGLVYMYRDLKFLYNPEADKLSITLPSGRDLTYHSPRLTRGTDPRKLEVWKISYMGVIDNTTSTWAQIHTYGGKLVENITQAVARDILAAAMLRVSAAGYNIVMHVHDEIIAEIPKGFGSIEELEAIMMIKESWFADWPIKAAGGWRGLRFRK